MGVSGFGEQATTVSQESVRWLEIRAQLATKEPEECTKALESLAYTVDGGSVAQVGVLQFLQPQAEFFAEHSSRLRSHVGEWIESEIRL
jgi:hypothetical protein